jgi:hypothetical protein
MAAAIEAHHIDNVVGVTQSLNGLDNLELTLNLENEKFWQYTMGLSLQ